MSISRPFKGRDKIKFHILKLLTVPERKTVQYSSSKQIEDLRNGKEMSHQMFSNGTSMNHPFQEFRT
jgi:hypothetical protein